MNRLRLSLVLVTTAAALARAKPAAAADWPQWRGSGSGVSSETGLPERLDAKDGIRWKTELPGRGVSCPVVSRGRIFTTSASGIANDRLHVLALDAASGARLWERQLWATGGTQCHPKTSMAAPTPVTDGERVYALFASLDMAAFDRDGTLVWYRSLALDYPNVTNQVGMASSPVFSGDLIVLALETDAEAFILAIEKRTGKNRWRTPRALGINWTTPVVRAGERGAELLLQSRHDITALDPATGKALWSHEENLDPIASPVASGSVVYAPAGETIALRPAGEGKPAEVLWRSQKLRSSTASPIVYDGRIYALSSAGILACASEATGEIEWQERLKGPFAASPVAADGRIYCVSEDGAASVVDVRGKERKIAKGDLGEPVLASPAISDGAVIVRTDKHIISVGKVESLR